MQFLHSEGYESVTTSIGASPLPHSYLQKSHLQKQSVLFVAALQALSHRAGNNVTRLVAPEILHCKREIERVVACYDDSASRVPPRC